MAVTPAVGIGLVIFTLLCNKEAMARATGSGRVIAVRSTAVTDFYGHFNPCQRTHVHRQTERSRSTEVLASQSIDDDQKTSLCNQVGPLATASYCLADHRSSTERRGLSATQLPKSEPLRESGTQSIVCSAFTAKRRMHS